MGNLPSSHGETHQRRKAVRTQRTVFTETVDKASHRIGQFPPPPSFLPCRRDSNCPIDRSSQRCKSRGKVWSPNDDLYSMFPISPATWNSQRLGAPFGSCRPPIRNLGRRLGSKNGKIFECPVHTDLLNASPAPASVGAFFWPSSPLRRSLSAISAGRGRSSSLAPPLEGIAEERLQYRHAQGPRGSLSPSMARQVAATGFSSAPPSPPPPIHHRGSRRLDEILHKFLLQKKLQPKSE